MICALLSKKVSSSQTLATRATQTDGQREDSVGDGVNPPAASSLPIMKQNSDRQEISTVVIDLLSSTLRLINKKTVK